MLSAPFSVLIFCGLPQDITPLFEGFENALTSVRGLHSYILSPGDDNYSSNGTSTKHRVLESNNLRNLRER
jgi:hypothetical protein